MKAIIGVLLSLWGLFLTTSSMAYTCDPAYQDSIKSECLNKQGNLLFGLVILAVGVLLIVSDIIASNKKKSEQS